MTSGGERGGRPPDDASGPPAAPEGDLAAALADLHREQDRQRWVLRLYVTGATVRSRQAIERLREVCEKHLHGRYELEVIDIYQLPALAEGHQIIATPTLVRLLPTPLRHYIGDLSTVEKVLFGLDLREKGP